MPTYSEDSYEKSVIELFENMGYLHLYGPDIERDYTDCLIESDLIEALERINKGLPKEAIKEALYKLRNFENGSLEQKNEVFMDYLQNGIQVQYKKNDEMTSSSVYIIDFNKEKNTYVVANQWT